MNTLSRLEQLLQALLNGETVEFDPQSRVEVYLKQLCEKFGTGTNFQSDWNQNDETAADYVKNRPLYKESGRVIYANGATNSKNQYDRADIQEYLTDGETYIVSVNNMEEQECVCENKRIYYYNESGEVLYEIVSTVWGEYYFNINLHNGAEATNHLYVAHAEDVWHKLPEECLDIDIVGKYGSNNNAEIFNDYVNNVASGIYSHAEGTFTTASDYATHAEGLYTTASNNSSHAEGYLTTASGDSSHAEGEQTVASGVTSHAEGTATVASGNGSHAEGIGTTSSGIASHAEGTGTTANSRDQHVQGAFNILDTENVASRGTYAHIVGNGTSYNDRSNAHTLDWNGNAWYAGTVEGTGLIVKSSTADSTKRFLITVDDAGALTATEIVETTE